MKNPQKGLITESVYRFSCTPLAAAYAILEPQGVTLIDSSYPRCGPGILRELRALGYGPEQVARILLTHCDGDHIGSALWLHRACRCPVYIGAEDLAFAVGTRRPPGFKGLVSRILSNRCPPETRPLPPQGFGEIQVLPTPGHTPGHRAFRSRNALLAGDLFTSSRDMLGFVPGIFTLDKPKIRESLRRLDLTGIDWLCPAHGRPMKRSPAWEAFQNRL